MSRQVISRLAYAGIAAGVLGVLSAVVLLAWPPQVAPGPVHYPFTTNGFRVAQAWFFIHHLGLVAVLVGLAASGAAGSKRSARAGAWLAVAGAVGLTGAELLAIQYANVDFAKANSGLMGAAYGVSCTAIGAGMLVMGIGVVRARRWEGWHRWMPLAVGVVEFLVLTPGLFAGFVAARMVIGFWMLLFALLGWSLRAEIGASTVSERSRVVQPA
ncbi:MAG: hypothetical protein ABR598_03280 [Candidatus Dormibacteria bacterium]